MLRTFLNVVVGLSCILMMSCSSAKITPSNFTVPLKPHFVDNHDGTFTDYHNHLQWTKDDLSPDPGYCDGGTEKSLRYLELYLDCLNKSRYLGYNDWRMPTYKDLESLLATPAIENGTIINSQVHERLKNHAYWSTVDIALFIHKRGIMIYNLIGPVYSYHQLSRYYVWPVRSNNNENLVASSN
jgi:hypothetical protein